jgi:hypothetical protein
MHPSHSERDAERVVVREGALGRGVYARRPFQPGEHILEFTGRVLPHREVLAMGEAQAYALQIGPDSYIDTEPLGRFTNHSCVPNSGIIGDRHLVALRPIEAGEEIRFDYSTTMSENFWTLRCRCGEAECRGVIRDFRHLAHELQEHYIRTGIVQSFIVREWDEHQCRSAELQLLLGAAAGIRAEASVRPAELIFPPSPSGL